MNKREHLLITLMEECAEVQKSCSKILRFGEDEDKLMSLNEEVNDVMGVVELLQQEEILEMVDGDKVDKKKEKVLKYLDLSQPYLDTQDDEETKVQAILLLHKLDNHARLHDGEDLIPNRNVKSYPTKELKKRIRKFLTNNG